MQLASRKARIGVSGIIIVMLCIVIFVGSLFYLSFKGPWVSNTLFPIQFTSNTDLPITPELESNQINLDEALKELKKEGCIITSYKKIDLSNTERLQYPEFKEKAVENGVVLVTPDELGDIILVIRNKKGQWAWSPN